ncbi:uncharacterized protein LOC119325455 isoform X1 [Triticum dicoccoides]|uniref:uncharacterized protein LOC119325455 isoform X1 n=1 Tax=Triticum dicoccoides TaxID=85692 RepID=UPI0018915689|nr:uncharacterized protein LOC119325455 isoform X1 [Triticum dicoccoides]
MQAAVSAASWLIGKVLNKLSDELVGAYLQPWLAEVRAPSSKQIQSKLKYMQGLLHFAQERDVSSNPGLQSLLGDLRKKADEIEDTLDELHYFMRQDQLDGTREVAPELGDRLRGHALHGVQAANHTIGGIKVHKVCNVCKNPCRDSLSHALEFGLFLREGFKNSVCIPCNIRVEFNNLIGDSFNFSDGQGLSYTIDVCKQNDKTIIGGYGWNKYISNNKLTGTEYIGFYLNKAVNKLRIKYFSDQDDELDEDDYEDCQDDEDDDDVEDNNDDERQDDDYAASQDDDSQEREDEEDDEGSGDDDDDDPYSSAIFSQRMKELTEDEKINLIAILPSSVHYLGRPFVHRFTKTNIVKHTMKLPMKMISGENIPATGMAGVHLGAAGPGTSIQYKTDIDGRISFYEGGWREFLKGKRQLGVDIAVVITIRNKRNNNFQMMVTIDLI